MGLRASWWQNCEITFSMKSYRMIIKGLAERPYAFIFKDHVYIRGNDIKFTEESYQERFKDKWVKFFKDRSVYFIEK